MVDGLLTISRDAKLSDASIKAIALQYMREHLVQEDHLSPTVSVEPRHVCWIKLFLLLEDAGHLAAV